MKEHIRVCVLLVTLVVIYVTGTLIFTKGFLLKRFVIDKNSSCNAEFSVQSDDHGDDGCWQHSRFKRAIIIVIDALKYEFVRFNPKLKDHKPFLNKLPFIHAILSRKRKNARLYKFVADPPTTTLQRLKGLTTGSLPTFVDAGSNFASSEITEDNLIDQLLGQNKKIKFLGDDTWMGLFPNRFFKAFPFPSFNVKDLHTVDDGILRHLMPEIRKRNWDVLIAHFLGVDHCGHRFGPNHPAMAEKLTQMDYMLRNVTKEMKDDTVLFVFGDHGMTRTGDHGGDSQDELEAGLFVYSPAQLTATNYKEDETATVTQTDLVPTLSLLLGVPIPFSNLGMVITELFSHCSWWKSGSSDVRHAYHTVKALRLNAHQINLYMQEYTAISSDFPEYKLMELRKILDQAEKDLQELLTSMVKEGETPNIHRRFQTLESQYVDFIQEIRETCQGIWARFDVSLILIGILTMLIGLVFNVLAARLLLDSGDKTMPLLVGNIGSFVYVTYVIIHSQFLSDYVNPMMVLVIGVMILLVLCVLIKNSFNKESTQENIRNLLKNCFSLDIAACVICAFYVALFFSNSFVVFEDSIVMFMSQIMVWAYGLKTMKQYLSKTETAKCPGPKLGKVRSAFSMSSLLYHPATRTLFFTLLCSLCLRSSVPFRVCREEQWFCNNTIFIEPLASLAVDGVSYRNVRYFFSLACLVFFIISIQQWMKHFGNLNGYSLSVLCIKFVIPFAGICCALHWAAQGLPQNVLDNLPWWQQILLAQLVYIALLISLTVFVLRPLRVYKLPSPRDTPISVPYRHLQGPRVISQVYQQLRRHWKSEEDEDKPPVVFGLGSAYSAAIIQVVMVTGLLCCLLLGDGLAPGIFVALITTFFFLEIYSASVFHQIETSENMLVVPWSLIVTHGLLMSTFFFATGHQTTVPSVRFEAAFTGFHGDFKYNIIPAFLITINTFASQIFFVVISPLLLFWPYLEGAVSQLMRAESKTKNQWRGDFVAIDDENSFKKSALKLIFGYMLFSGLKVFGSMCAAGLHRRHLMVWKIFAPRFVFEGASFFVTFIVMFIMYLFVWRVHRSVKSFAKILSQDR